MDEVLNKPDVNTDDVEELKERRIQRLIDAGIDEDAILRLCVKATGGFYAYFQENITHAKNDMQFSFVDQWLPQERQEFSRLFKPCMQFNMIADPVKKILGEHRKNKPDLMVRGFSQDTDQDQIDFRADLIRHYTYKSQNDLIYQAALNWSLCGGYAALQVDIQYENPMSFNQEPVFRLIQDPLLCFFDPAAQMPHKGDGNYCGRIYLFGKEEFATKYPYIDNPISYSNLQMLTLPDFIGSDLVAVCDFYVKEWYSCKLYGLSNGTTVTEEEWEEMQASIKEQEELAEKSTAVGDLIAKSIPRIVNERQTEKYRIMNYQLTNNAIIDFREWPSTELPIVFVDGNSLIIDGKQVTKSFIKDAKDAQKFVNYVGSEITGEIKNRRREQWIGTKENITGNEEIWSNPETSQGILLAVPDPKKGGDPMPTKSTPWDLSPALLTQFQRGVMDVKQILGFHEELEGGETNAQSGVAIMRRQTAASMSAYVYVDNLNQAIEQCGRIVLDVLPKIIGDQERTIVIRKKDGKMKSLTFNKPGADGKTNVLDDGRYDVEIDTGPSFAVQKEASLSIMMQLLQVSPQTFPLMADLIASNLDLQSMPQLVERFKTLVPPQIIAKENGDPNPPAPQPSPQDMMAQQQLKAMQQEFSIKEQRLQNDQEELNIKRQKLALEQEKSDIEKIALQMQAKNQSEDRHAEIHRANLQYNSSVNKLVGDLHNSAADRHHSTFNTGNQ